MNVVVSCSCGGRPSGPAGTPLRCPGCGDLLVASVSRLDVETGELLPLRSATPETGSRGAWEPSTTPFAVAVRIRPLPPVVNYPS